MRLIPGPAGHIDLSTVNDSDDGHDRNGDDGASHVHHRRRIDSSSSSSAVSLHTAVKEVFLSVGKQVTPFIGYYKLRSSSKALVVVGLNLQ